MNWDSLIEVLMDKVPDADIRESIYKSLLEYCDYSDLDMIEEVMGTDAAFDLVATDFIDDINEDEEDDDDEYDEDDDWGDEDD